MKSIFFLFTFLLFTFSVNCQNIGIKTNLELQKNSELKKVFGAGLFFNNDSIYKRCGLFISANYNYSNSRFVEKGFELNYQRYSIDLSLPFAIKLYEKLILKIGPILSFDIIAVDKSGIYSNWMSTCYSKFVGTGLTTILNYKSLLKTPLDFNVIICPLYLFNLNYKTDPTNAVFDYTTNTFLLNIEIGLSYKLNK